MFKLLTVFLVILFLFGASPARANQSNSFVTVANPVRGSDFWDLKDQIPVTVLNGQVEILKKYNIPATWLVRFDALKDQTIVESIKRLPASHQVGLFLEVTPSWTTGAAVNYRESEAWHFAGSVLLAGYDLGERKKLIERAFEDFKNVFGYYPKSVGAWWIDSYSMSKMESQYQINSALIVADQYSTDNYQIWGQYWQAPYYPAKANVLSPAQTLEHRIPVVVTQWAARDPINGFGKGVEESTLSVQPNDYIDYHNLDINYFNKLVDIYTKQDFNQVNQLVVGLENTYSWQKYATEYQKQIELLAQKQRAGQFNLVTMSDFAAWYKTQFPSLSPQQIVVADDPLGSSKKVVWFMNPYYRAGWFYTGSSSVFRDIRQYLDASEELCLKTSCTEVNFATFATRVLDEVTKGNRWEIDQGQISNFKVISQDNNLKISYHNQTGNPREIEFLLRDISLDKSVSSIDAAILQATGQTIQQQQDLANNYFKELPVDNLSNPILSALKFILFVIFALLLPGFVLMQLTFGKISSFILRTFLAICTEIVALTLLYYLASLFKVWWLVLVYLGVMLFMAFKKRLYQDIEINISKRALMGSGLILAGTLFQIIPVWNSGSLTKYGIGFWGPNAHDGTWHLALAKQLVQNVVPQNPIFSGQNLQNYHYFYDLLLALTHKITGATLEDLIFKFYPLLLSLLFGIGTYYLAMRLFKSSRASLLAVYLVYFTGSFGWMVEFIRERHIGGESAFWSNQPVSFNLNPPFAISLVLLIAFTYLLSLYLEQKNNRKAWIILIIILGSLISFKAYAALLAGGAMVFLVLFRLIKNKDFSLLAVLAGAVILSLIILLPNYQLDSLAKAGTGLFIFAPFWFVHSMIDSPDRVGWNRLSLTRMVGFEGKNYLKIIGAETIGLLIFWAGNLGVRILSFALLGKIKLIFKDHLYLFLFFLTFLALTVPLLLIQVGNPWNTIQFFYYGLYTTAVFSAVVLSRIFTKGILGKAVVLMVLAIAPINALVTGSSYLYPLPHAALSSGELSALKFLSKQPPGVVLTYPFNANLRQAISAPFPMPVYETTAYVSAFSGHQAYLEDLIQQDILQTDVKPRLIYQSYFFKDFDDSKRKEFLKKEKISYIYLPHIFNVTLPADKLNLQVIYQNQSATLYKVLN